MGTIILVVGWVLWGFALLFGLGSLSSGSPDGAVRSAMRTQGLTLVVACALTAFLPISRLWLLAAFPVAFLLPMLLMRARFGRIKARIKELERESEATGVPLVDLVKRETERIEGK